MRVIQIDDQELFLYKLDGNQFKFYRKNRNALKKMWTAQGPTYWLRFLLKFQISFEDYMTQQTKLGAFICTHYEKHIPDFVYIRIHKQFIEGTFDTVEAFIENVFRIVQNFYKVSQQTSDNALFSEDCLDNFKDAIEDNGDCRKVIYSSVVSLLCVMYCGFVDGLLNLLKKWLKEPDISKENEKNIDLTIYYWRPVKSWECKKFTPTCFEKYLANHYTESLPKLLLTCNAHNIFGTHVENDECSCQYKDEESIFGLLKDKYKLGKPASLGVIAIFRPEIVSCQDHQNCLVKLQHGKECLEPYICMGGDSCTKTCETALKNRRKEETKHFWGKCTIEVFDCKKGNKRNVSIQVESRDTVIETFCSLNENRKKQVCLDLEELFYCNYDPNFRNSYTQQKRKEEYRRKLRKKLQWKYEFDSDDPDQLKDMYDDAQRIWLNEICVENYRELFALKNSQTSDFEKALFKIKKALTSVAIGTSSIVFGRVVLPSKRSCSNANCSTTEVKVSISTQKNTKKKKKKSVVATTTTTTTEITQVKIRSESVSNINYTSEAKNEKVENKIASNSVTSVEIENRNDSKTNSSSPEKFIDLKNDSKMKNSSPEKSIDTKNGSKMKNSSPEKSIDLKNQLKEDLKKNSSPEKSIDLKKQVKDDLKISSNPEQCIDLKNKIKNYSKRKNSLSPEKCIDLEKQMNDIKVCNQSEQIMAHESCKEPQNKPNYKETESSEEEKNTISSGKTAELCDKEKSKVKEAIPVAISSEVNTVAKSSEVDTVAKSSEVDTVASEIPSDGDDELNTFFNFVINGEGRKSDIKENFNGSVDITDPQNKPNIGVADLPHKLSIGNEASIEKLERKNKFKTCAYCLKKEVVIKSFKRCSRCKAENMPNQYFYCSRDCQVADWEKSHRELHLKASSNN